jgi:hypothetical protein
MSLGYFALLTQRPRRLHRIRLKYSWRGYDKKLRESVTIPIKSGRTERAARDLSCSLYALFVIVKPPGGALLQLAFYTRGLEAADNGPKRALSVGLRE